MTTSLFLNGEWVAASAGSIATLDPSDGALIEYVGRASADDVDSAVRAARSALRASSWAGLAPAARAGLLFGLAALVDEHADELAALETRNQGQPLVMSREIAVRGAAEHLRYYAGWVTKIEGRTMPASAPDTHLFTRREPVGVCGLIVPWNAPLMILAWKLAPALATGNTVVVKPAEQTPLSAIRLVELCAEAGLPPGVVNLVTGDAVAGEALARHPDVDLLSFTGSTAVGRRVAIAAAETNLKRVVLELGGKAPSVIAADADIDAAVAGNVVGGTINSGQVCAAYTRFFVDCRRENEFVEKLAAGVSQLRLGPGTDSASQLGPLVSEHHLQHVDSLVRRASTEGAELVTGGRRHGERGFFYEPTVFRGVHDEMAIAREEVFGPVLSVLAYDEEDELEDLVKRCNDTEYGLAAAVWTRNIETAHRLANGIDAGAVFVNQLPIPDMTGPWGGFKASGWSNEMGPGAIDSYTRTKGVWMHYA